MSNAIRSMKLDILMSKQYGKTFLILIAGGVVYTAILRVFVSGVLFSMLVAATASCYPFATVETCGGERLYGILPIKRAQAVVGRYLYCFLVGLLTILICTGLSLAVYSIMGIQVTRGEVLTGLVIGVLMFAVSISFQLPGYYKLGSTKGRSFTFVPMLLYFGSFMLLEKVGVQRVLEAMGPLADPRFFAAGLVVLILLMLAVSVKVSVGIYNKKGM